MAKINIRQLAVQICDEFENLLEKHNIDIPDEDREGEESEAHIYGTTYSNLEGQITDILTDFINEIKREGIELETYSYNFDEIINGVYYINEEEEGNGSN